MSQQFDHQVSVDGVRGYFDALGLGEWERRDASPAERVSFEVHRRFLARWVSASARVLEVGAGPGHFTIELARLGARVVVTDISPIQLELNARFVAEAGCEAAVERREVVDVCDLGRYSEHEFDVVVAYGGPLSYAFDAAAGALAGMLRVVRRNGPVVASVMSTLGAYRHFLPAVVQVADDFGDDAIDRILATGDLRETQPPEQGHSCKMFRFSEVRDLVHNAGARLAGASASNWTSLGDPAAVEHTVADPHRWSKFVEQEVAICVEPGVLDGGTHILFAAIAEHPPD
jgi:SAM-dependent methyltransferase